MADELENGVNSPCVSVVVPVKNGEATIERCLEAIVNQQFDGRDFEVILVDNGSTDRTLKIVSERFPQVKILLESRPGVSYARNLAIQEAKGTWIAFTDADCVPTATWIKSLVNRAEECQGVSFVGGAIRALLPTTAIGLFNENLFDQQRSIEAEKPPSFISANLIARRDDLIRFGMFNPNYPRGQDTEFAWRSYFKHGAKFAFAGDAVVEHANESTWSGLIKKAWQHGSGSARLISEYQEELKINPEKRCGETKFRKEFIRAGLANVKSLLLFQRGELRTKARDRFYFAVFRFVRHLSYVHHFRKLPKAQPIPTQHSNPAKQVES